MNLVVPVILFISVIITTFNRGFFSFGAGTLVIALLILMVYAFGKRPVVNPDKTQNGYILSFLLIIVYSLFLFFSGGIYQSHILPSVLLVAVSIAGFFLIFAFLNQKTGFFLLIFLAIILKLLMIKASPAPVIDVFTILKEAPQILLSGRNPYNWSYSATYKGVPSDYFAYWPVSFLLQIPFSVVFNDPRVLLVLADIMGAILIYLLGRKSQVAQLLALIYLFRPNSNFITEQSWLVSLEFMFMAAAVYICMNTKKFKTRGAYLAAAVTGLLIGIKPHYAVIIPFFLFTVNNWKKYLTGIFAVLVFSVGPFIAWDAFHFFRNSVGGFFFTNEQNWWIPFQSALSLNALYFNFTGSNIPFVISASVLLLAIIILLVKLAGQKRNLPNWLLEHVVLAISIFFCVFNLFFRYSFINEYYFLGGLLILWADLYYNPPKMTS